MRLLQLVGIFLCCGAMLQASGDKSDFPLIKTDSQGNALSIWQMSVDNVREIQASSYSSEAQAWSVSSCISTQGADATLPILKMNSAGNAVAIWLESTSDARVLKAARFNIKNGWSSPYALSTSDHFVNDNFSVQINDSGVAFAVWHAHLSHTGEYGVFASSSTNAANWTSPTNISCEATKHSAQRARPVKLSPVLKTP